MKNKYTLDITSLHYLNKMTSELKKRDALLMDVKANLKDQFTGIDSVIDQFIDAVRVWYIGVV
jgi:hypothetical protein